MSSPIVGAFQSQSRIIGQLGSPFTARICRLFAENLDHDSPVGKTIHGWEGDPAAFADNLPLRVAGALHGLVIAKKCPELIQVYPPDENEIDDLQLWSAIKHALNLHSEFIIERLAFPPQTNEVRRSAVLLPGFMVVADKYKLPLKLSEIGVSAGLNMVWDEHRYTLGGASWGNESAAIHLQPKWEGPDPVLTDIEIVDRAGCDLNPLHVSDREERERLLSYIWADQPERMERTATAMDLVAALKPSIDKADAQDWLSSRLAGLCPGVAHVIYHSIVWQYFPEETKTNCRKILEEAGKSATLDAPLSWLRMETDGDGPGAGVRLTLWPGGLEYMLGRADFHGRWVKWNGVV